MMHWIGKLFHRNDKTEACRLRVAGCKATLTPAPDDAELAAQALLESSVCQKKERQKKTSAEEKPGGKAEADIPHDAAYYKRLSEKMRDGRETEKRLAMRYLAYCEEQLAIPKELYTGQVSEMEREMYKWQDVVEREGGKLLSRWQKCLAECILRGMSTSHTDSTERTEDTEK